MFTTVSFFMESINQSFTHHSDKKHWSWGSQFLSGALSSSASTRSVALAKDDSLVKNIASVLVNDLRAELIESLYSGITV